MAERSLHFTGFRKRLAEWYRAAGRPLPWRATRDPYRIWVSEIMLQQTRVAAVIPYYERFLKEFPDAAALAGAGEARLLQLWAGLGYYSRARNLHRAARQIVESGAFPADYDGIRSLPGVGDYTAAAVGSIAFGLPHAVLDGNVLRVLARLANDSGEIGSTVTRRRLAALAGRLLDRADSGAFNQAMMELGAVICVPRQPQCGLCPVARHCEARRAGTEAQLPVKLRRTAAVRVEKTVLVVERNGDLLLWRRGPEKRMAGYWELPDRDLVPGAEVGEAAGSFRHSIMNRNYEITVARGRVRRRPPGFEWVAKAGLEALPLSTTARKALQLWQRLQ